MWDSRDELHGRAQDETALLQGARIVTSQMVLVEVLTHFGDRSDYVRRAAVSGVRALEEDVNVEVVPQSSDQFDSAVSRYASRSDQAWSPTDCASFIIMERMGISEALAYDRDFEQAGYVALLRPLNISP